MKKIFCLLFTAFVSFSGFAQFNNTMGHNGEITALINDTSSEGSFFSIGEDGFLVHWSADNKVTRYQITDNEIKFAVKNPVKQEIAIYETDGNTIHTVSVWDCVKLNKKFSVNFTDSLLSLTYSKKGTYLIAGTSTEEGTIFINSSNGNIEHPITDKMNMMAYIETANSEKSLLSYSLTGNITYYSFEQKKMLGKKIPSLQGLENILTFNRFKYIAGVKSNSIFIVDATTGKTVLEHPAIKPLIFTINEELYFFDQTSAKSGAVFKFTLSDGKINKPEIYQNFTFKLKDRISCVLPLKDKILFGITSGDIFSSEFIQNETKELVQLSDDSFQKIFDVAYVEDNLYILTNKFIYRFLSNEKKLEQITSNTDFNHMLDYRGNLVLWSSNKALPVSKYDLTSNKLSKLFSPQGQLVTLKVCSDQLIDIESGTTVKLYNPEKNSLQEIYYGSGIQDAVMLGQNELYIAKSVTSSIDSSLVFVNTKTHETLPLKVSVDFVYAITNDEYEIKQTPEVKHIYALGIIKDAKKSKTVLLKFDAVSSKMEVLHEYNELSLHSYEYAYNQNVFTNIAESKISGVNTKSKKLTAYNRSTSLPKKVTANNDDLYFVNQDGSLSILQIKSSSIQNDMIIDNEGNIINIKY